MDISKVVIDVESWYDGIVVEFLVELGMKILVGMLMVIFLELGEVLGVVMYLYGIMYVVVFVFWLEYCYMILFVVCCVV